MPRTREAITEEGIIKRMTPRWCPVAFIGDHAVAWLNLATGEIVQPMAFGPDALVVGRGKDMGVRPTIVTLCGSTRFYRQYQEANYEATLAGKIVLSVAFFPDATVDAHGEEIGITPEQKAALDTLHLQKIAMSDEVFILDVGGYIGESTAREIRYAEGLGKPISYWSKVKGLTVQVN